MKILIELNEQIEINGLIQIGKNIENFKNELIEQLKGLYIDGEGFYKKYCKVYEKYSTTFSKNMIVNKDEEIFFKDDNIGLMFCSINILEKKIPSTDIEFRNLIVKKYTTFRSDKEIESIEDIVNLVETSKSLKDDEKWRLITILKSPRNYYEKFNEVIDRNRGAYKYALESIEKKYSKLLDSYQKYIVNADIPWIGESFDKDKLTIIPSIAYSVSVLMIMGHCFYGVLNPYVEAERKKKNSTSGLLLSQLKALSDKSKLEIMIFLKSGSRYSQEIAEKLELTPATVSYHMNALLNCDMVKIEKRDGKVYYEINKNGTRDFINELNNIL